MAETQHSMIIQIKLLLVVLALLPILFPCKARSLITIFSFISKIIHIDSLNEGNLILL